MSTATTNPREAGYNFDYRDEIQLDGYRVDIEIDHETGEVALGLPESSTSYVFASADWDRIVAMINRAEIERGKVVSTTWSGQ